MTQLRKQTMNKSAKIILIIVSSSVTGLLRDGAYCPSFPLALQH